MNNKRTSIFHKIITSQYFGWIRSACLLLVFVFLFTYASFAWLRREWTPYVHEEGITVSTSGSLAFQLVDSGQATTGMSINKILKLGDDFVLKPVSNVSGMSNDFFSINSDEGVGKEVYEYLDVQNYLGLSETASAKAYSQMGIDNGYIEFQLALIAPEDEPGYDRYIYIHEDSYIAVSSNTLDQEEVVECVRVSVTIQGGTVQAESKTFVFAADIKDAQNNYKVKSHSGLYNGKTLDDKRYMDGVDFYDSYTDENTNEPKEKISVNGQEQNIVIDSSESYTGVPTFGYFKDYNGGIYGDVNGEHKLVTSDTKKALFAMNSSIATNPTITVRIWVEGTHPSCTDAISDAQIDLKLQFSSFTAPSENAQN